MSSDSRFRKKERKVTCSRNGDQSSSDTRSYSDPSFDGVTSTIEEVHLSCSVEREVEQPSESERRMTGRERFESVVDDYEGNIVSTAEPEAR